MSEKGFIALDVDGTLTSNIHQIPERVIAYLHKLQSEGFEILMITGRPYTFAEKVFRDFDFPFHLAVQNGADIVRMPGSTVEIKNYLPKEILYRLQPLCDEIGRDFLAYAGPESGDSCYYRSLKNDADLLDYYGVLQDLCEGIWSDVETIDAIKQNAFPLLKILGKKEELTPLLKKVEEWDDVQSCMIRDPIRKDLHMVLLTDQNVNKGKTLQKLTKDAGNNVPIIAAGDDFNDLSMLEAAQFAIVMDNAPEELKKMADFVAPHVSKMGIIDGLEVATGIAPD